MVCDLISFAFLSFFFFLSSGAEELGCSTALMEPIKELYSFSGEKKKIGRKRRRGGRRGKNECKHYNCLCATSSGVNSFVLIAKKRPQPFPGMK